MPQSARSHAQSIPMPNLTSILKAEITRLARKELKPEVDGLRKALSAIRSDVAALKKRVQELERQVARAGKPRRTASSVAPVQVTDAEKGAGLRFRAAGMAANRKRLGLSAADFGKLVGATGQSVYAWEAGKSKPRGQNLAAIAALRGIGKRDVAERLAALG